MRTWLFFSFLFLIQNIFSSLYFLHREITTRCQIRLYFHFFKFFLAFFSLETSEYVACKERTNERIRRDIQGETNELCLSNTKRPRVFNVLMFISGEIKRRKKKKSFCLQKKREKNIRFIWPKTKFIRMTIVVNKRKWEAL